MLEIMRQHQGPIIFAGDFNTWNQRRISLVERLTASLELHPASFDDSTITRYFGHRLDHIYYRGLIAVERFSFPVKSSDHQPLTVTFKLP